MTVCANCGNDYDKTFQVVMNDKTYAFDSFECAIQSLAPTCAHCDTRIVGHGLETEGTYYCCAHCATQEGEVDFQDRV